MASLRVLGPQSASAEKGKTMATHVWERASFDRELLVPLAPDGYEAVVEVFLHGRPEPIVPSLVENRKDGWLRIPSTEHGDDGSEKWHHSHSLIHAHESAVARVEVVFRKQRPSGPIGFRFGTADEEAGMQSVVS
jgi:hypothetical protein